MPLLNEDAQRGFLQYKYASQDNGLLSNYVLQPYWTWLVTLFPTTIAPNMITLMGFAFVAGSCALFAVLDPLSEGVFSGKDLSVAYVFAGVSFFIYQSLDAIDGKQARRTGLSGPLGELFDHGCDALALPLLSWPLYSALSFGASWWNFWGIIISSLNFYLLTLEEYYTGSLRLGLVSGPVEGLLAASGVLLFSGLYGAGLFTRDWAYVFHVESYVPLWAHLSLGKTIVFATCVMTSLGNIEAVINVVRLAHASSGLVELFKKAIPAVLLYTSAAVWVHYGRLTNTAYLAVFMLFFGVAFATLATLTTVSRLGKVPLPPLAYVPGSVAAALGALDAYLTAAHPGLPTASALFGPGAVLWGAVLVAVLWHGYVIKSVVSMLCALFDIWCLRIKPKGKKE